MHMSLGEHIEELRRRVIYALLGVVGAMLLTMYYGRDLVVFLAEPLNRAQRAAGLPPQTVVHGVTKAFTIYLKTAMISAAVLASPWVIYQLWKFIAAGLYYRERRAVYLLTPLSTAMTGAALAFSYYILLPVCLSFLIFFSIGYGPPGGETPSFLSFLTGLSGRAAMTAPAEPPPPDEAQQGPPEPPAPDGAVIVPRLEQDPPNPVDGSVWIKVPEGIVKIRIEGRTMMLYSAVSSLVNPWLELGAYIDFVLLMTLGVVIGFQMPVVMLIVGMTGMVDPAWLARYRRHCLFICAALGAMLTPADPFSMIVLAVPLYGLFELGLLLMRSVARRRAAAESQDAGDAT